LCRYCKAIDYGYTTEPSIRLCQAVIYAGYRKTRADVKKLISAELALKDVSQVDDDTAFRYAPRTELKQWLQESPLLPLSLMAQSRIAIRRQLSLANQYHDIRPAIAALTALPEQMKQYLIFESQVEEIDLSLPESEMDVTDNSDSDAD